MNDSEQTEGEYLTALGFFEPFPFRHFVPQRWLEYGRLALLPLATLPIPPDSPLALSSTGRARLESPARGDSFCLALPKGFFSPSRSYCDGAAEKNSI